MPGQCDVTVEQWSWWCFHKPGNAKDHQEATRCKMRGPEHSFPVLTRKQHYLHLGLELSVSRPSAALFRSTQLVAHSCNCCSTVAQFWNQVSPRGRTVLHCAQRKPLNINTLSFLNDINSVPIYHELTNNLQYGICLNFKSIVQDHFKGPRSYSEWPCLLKWCYFHVSPKE